MNSLPSHGTPLWASQASLFDTPIRGHRALATFIGGFFEILVAKMISGNVLITDGNFALCPDIVCRDGKTALEVKSISTRNRIHLFDKQYEKYCGYRDLGYKVVFAFMVYKGETQMFAHIRPSTVKATVDYLSTRIKGAILVDLAIIDHWVKIFIKGNWSRSREHDPALTAYTSINPLHLLEYMNDPMRMVREADLGTEDFVVIQTGVKGINVGGTPIDLFPLVAVISKAPATADIRLDEIEVVREWATPDDEVSEVETPF